MITKEQDGNSITYISDNGKKAVVNHYKDRISIQTFDEGKSILQEFKEQEEATKHLREFLNAIPLDSFLRMYKGMINQKGLAKCANKSVNYMSHIATGRRPSSPELNKAIEDVCHELGKQLININII